MMTGIKLDYMEDLGSTVYSASFWTLLIVAFFSHIGLILFRPYGNHLVWWLSHQRAQKCDLPTFFHAGINQSEVEGSFQLASDWIKSARKNVNKSKWSHFWAFCCKG